MTSPTRIVLGVLILGSKAAPPVLTGIIKSAATPTVAPFLNLFSVFSNAAVIDHCDAGVNADDETPSAAGSTSPPSGVTIDSGSA